MSTTMASPGGRPDPRPRSKSTFSFKSDKSHKSQGKDSHHRTGSKDEHHKAHTAHLTTKADPNSAMNEVQPIAAALEKPTLQSLRSFQHTDMSGQPIADPDLSNPTRSRWERPLDTIRSFEAAIDEEYKRRSMAIRGEAPSEAGNGYGSRRSSYYNAHEQYGYRNSPSHGGGYYGNRQSPAARESWADGGFPAGPGPRSRYHRQQHQSGQYDNGWNARPSNGHSGVYPTPGYHQSRDTVLTGGSDSNHSAGPYSTDPSSDNSSIERGNSIGGPVKQPQPELSEQYGFSGFGGNSHPIHEELGNYGSNNYSRGPTNHGNGYYQPGYDNNHGAPPAPPKAMNQPLANNPNVTKLNGAPAVGGERPGLLRKNTSGEDKRKSWFKRRFSKN